MLLCGPGTQLKVAGNAEEGMTYYLEVTAAPPPLTLCFSPSASCAST